MTTLCFCLEMATGMLCRFLLLARLDCNILGPHEAKEIAASDIFTWPSVEVVSCTTLESWAIPPLQPLSVPEHVEAGSDQSFRHVWRVRAQHKLSRGQVCSAG